MSGVLVEKQLVENQSAILLSVKGVNGTLYHFYAVSESDFDPPIKPMFSDLSIGDIVRFPLTSYARVLSTNRHRFNEEAMLVYTVEVKWK
jgi:hypothetical protein